MKTRYLRMGVALVAITFGGMALNGCKQASVAPPTQTLTFSGSVSGFSPVTDSDGGFNLTMTLEPASNNTSEGFICQISGADVDWAGGKGTFTGTPSSDPLAATFTAPNQFDPLVAAAAVSWTGFTLVVTGTNTANGGPLSISITVSNTP